MHLKMTPVFVAVVYNYYGYTDCLGVYTSQKEAVDTLCKYHKTRKPVYAREPKPVDIPDLEKVLTRDGKYSFYEDVLDRWGAKYHHNYKIYFVREVKGDITGNFVLVIQDAQQPANLECFVSSTREAALEIVIDKTNKPSWKIRARFEGNYYVCGGKKFFIDHLKKDS